MASSSGYGKYFQVLCLCCYGLSLANGDDWRKIAQDSLKESLKLKWNTGIAKNVILMIGDGMGLSTVTASRIYKGQLAGNRGEETVLEFEKFPHVALSKTYGNDKQIPDSAQSATALMCGAKANWYTFGVRDTVYKNDCSAQLQSGANVTSILHHCLASGKATGIVSTARLTHATPGTSYGHTANRKWEGDVKLVDMNGDCKDIAYQFVNDNSDIQVAFAGGRRFFLPNTTLDPEYNKTDSNQRRDGQDLIEVWKNNQRSKGRRYKYVWNKGQFDDVDPATTDYVLGLFEPSHMQYEMNRDRSRNGEPSIAEMTSKAIKILRKNAKGYFLLVEGARIDHAHHDSYGRLALHETIAFEEAVKEAARLTSEEDTLLIVTADHSHVFNIGGYPHRGNDILGLMQPEADEVPLDGKPYTTLLYGNGPAYQYGNRQNLTDVDIRDKSYQQQSAVPVEFETHGGEDVGVYARGPMSHLIHGVQEQQYFAYVMQYASCVGEYKNNCDRLGEPNLGIRQPLSTYLTFLSAIFLSFSFI